MPDNQVLRVREIVDNGVAQLRQMFFSDPVPALLVGDVHAAMNTIEATWRETVEVLTNLPGVIAMVRKDAKLTPEAKRSDVAAAIAQARTTATGGLTLITTTVERLTKQMRALSMPQRPAPADAAQEARLAGLKTDVKMLLDGLSGDAVALELIALVERYRAADDALAVWMLAASPWPCMYLQSRALDETAFTARLPGALVGLAGDDSTVRFAMRALGVLEGPKGLLGATVGMGVLINMAIDGAANPLLDQLA